MRQHQGMVKLGSILLMILTLFVFTPGLFAGAKDVPEDLLKAVREEGNKLNVFNWGYYIAEDTIPNFEKEFGIKVTYDTFEAADAMLAKIQAGGSGYDVVVADNEYIQYLQRMDLALPTNHQWIPNMKNLMDKFVNPSFDPGNKFSVAYLWGSAGFVYNTKYTKDDPRLKGLGSWAIIFEGKEYAGRIGMLDSWGVCIGSALLYLGYDFNTHNPKELMEAKDVLVRQKEWVKAYGLMRKLLEAEEVYLATLWSGDSVAVHERVPTIHYCTPKEGMMIYVDNLAIPKDAPHPAAAHLWMNYNLRGKVAGNNANYVHFATTNKAALPFIDKKDRENAAIYPPAEVMEKCVFSDAFTGEALKLREELWEEVKAR